MPAFVEYPPVYLRLLHILISSFCLLPALAAEESPVQWRKERRLIDLHQHVGSSEALLKRAVSIMNLAGIGVGVNLSGGTVTHKKGRAFGVRAEQGVG